MLNEKTQLISEIKRLSNRLDNQYTKELNFRNHCYLRIAYDNTTQDKWDKKVAKPFVKYATIAQLQNAVDLLNVYLSDKLKLLSDNEKSLNFRKKSEDILLNFQNKLFKITLFIV
jgi:hypothetical protein